MDRAKYIKISIFLLVFSLMSIESCSLFKNVISNVEVSKPEVSVISAKIDTLSFTYADLLFDLKVKNPNSIGLKLNSFDYDLLIEGTSFLSGKHDKELQIEGNSESIIQLPLRVIYKNLFTTYQSIKEKDSSHYQLESHFSFDVPVLGEVTVPVRKEGELPVLKLPSVQMKALRLTRLGITTADLELVFLFNNPNALSILIDHFQYRFTVNNQDWVSGDKLAEMEIDEKGESLLQIPITLNFINIGQSIYELLEDEKSFHYSFQGKIDFTTSIPLIGPVKLPFDHSGNLTITR